MTLTTSPYGPGVVLSNDVLYYLFVDTGGSTRPHTPSDIGEHRHAVDLTGFSESVFYTSEDEITAVVGTGDRLHLVDSYNQTLISLDATGATVGQSDISALGGGNINGLTVHQQGLLALNYGGYKHMRCRPAGRSTAAKRRRALSTPRRCCAKTGWLWTAMASSRCPYPLTNPIWATTHWRGACSTWKPVLFGAEPAAVPQPGNRQRLASSVYPFRLDNAATSVELATDRPAYRRNVPGYSPDDTLSAVTLSGRVRNTGPTSGRHHASDPAQRRALVLSQTFSAVAPNDAAVQRCRPGAAAGRGGLHRHHQPGRQRGRPDPGGSLALTAASMVTPTTQTLGEGVSIEVSLANPEQPAVIVTADRAQARRM